MVKIKYLMIIGVLVLFGFIASCTNSELTREQARLIAEESCIKGGESLDAGTYNQGTKTWWFDANLNSVHEGCNPACVVSEDTKTAEINWRCTGLLPQ